MGPLNFRAKQGERSSLHGCVEPIRKYLLFRVVFAKQQNLARVEVFALAKLCVFTPRLQAGACGVNLRREQQRLLQSRDELLAERVLLPQLEGVFFVGLRESQQYWSQFGLLSRDFG